MKKIYYYSKCVDCKKLLRGKLAIRCIKCQAKRYSILAKGKKHPHKFFGKFVLCETCNKIIYRKPYRIKRAKHLFCSKSCASKFRKGALAGNWKGGKKKIYDLIRGLEEYNEWRKNIFKRDNYICQECGKRGFHLHAHHCKIKYGQLMFEFLKEYNQFSPIEDKETLIRLAMKWKPFWDIDNGITLCKDCHKEKHVNLNLFKTKLKNKEEK